jgi:hypothetical protein
LAPVCTGYASAAFPTPTEMRRSWYIALLLTVLPAVVAQAPVPGQAETDDPGIASAQGTKAIRTRDDDRFTSQFTPDQSCTICHCDNNLIGSASYPEGLWLDPQLLAQSAHATLRCVDCHNDLAADGHGKQPFYNLPDAFPSVLDSPALQSCTACHPAEYAAYRGSAHGSDVLVKGEDVPPYCTDCHGVHYILPATDLRSWTNPAHIAQNCLKCHSVDEIKQRYGLTLDVAGTYQRSFHGLRAQLGGAEVAECTTCHGNHSIFRTDDAKSRVSQAELARRCGECHPGARLNFTAAFSHKKISEGEQSWLFNVKQTHLWLIVICTVGFALVVLSDLRYRLRAGEGSPHA